MLNTFLTVFLAAPTEPGIDNATGDGMGGTLLMILLMVALFYFMLFRPQKKKEKEDRALRSSLTPGDEIITIGGYTGRILSVKDDNVTFESGPDRTKLTVKVWAIQSKVSGEKSSAKELEDKTDKDEKKKGKKEE